MLFLFRAEFRALRMHVTQDALVAKQPHNPPPPKSRTIYPRNGTPLGDHEAPAGPDVHLPARSARGQDETYDIYPLSVGRL